MNRIASWYWQFRYQQIEQDLHDPIGSQERVLKSLIQKAQSTSFGQSHHFREISSIAHFQEAVPIHQYDDLIGDIQLMMDGKADVLWPGAIHDFGKTAGTSSNSPKFIPLSMEMLQHNHSRGSRDVMSFFCHRFPETAVFTGKGLILGGTFYQDPKFPEARIGDISAFMVRYMPWLASLFLFPGKSVTLLPDWEQKIQLIAEKAIQESITNITGMPTWILVFAKEVCRITGKDRLVDVWPELQVFNHGGMQFDLYEPLFDNLLPRDRVYYHDIYNATEGFFAFREHPEQEGMRLLLRNAVYYEFQDLNSKSILSLREVEIGKPYALVISNAGGLWRYIQGDIIEFTEVHPYRIKVLGRLNQCLNDFGELVDQTHLETALGHLVSRYQLSVSDFTVMSSGLNAQGKGKHSWFLELENRASLPADVAEELDYALIGVNANYQKRRLASMVLERPEIVVLPAGTILQWHRSRGQLGGQTKLSRIQQTDSGFRQFISSLSPDCVQIY
ncbi:MAG: GH3 auxin-responsive promoter family protein [Bacteroidota bacterium]